MSCILGYTIGNDVSERTWQRSDRTLWRAKNTDTFKPMGPWIETSLDLDEAETIIRVNGQVSERFPTNAMIFGVATFISRMSRCLTLHPGDMVWMGTDGHRKIEGGRRRRYRDHRRRHAAQPVRGREMTAPKA